MKGQSSIGNYSNKKQGDGRTGGYVVHREECHAKEMLTTCLFNICKRGSKKGQSK